MTDHDRLMGLVRICEDTECWLWLGGMGGANKATPTFHFPCGHKKRSIAAYRAAWEMAGRTIPPRRFLYRTCGDMRCVSPDHCATGTRRDIARNASRHGRLSGPARCAAALRAVMGRMVPMETVRRIESMLAQGMRRMDVAEAAGVEKGLVTKVKMGRHFHSSRRQRVVAGASVFTWRP